MAYPHSICADCWLKRNGTPFAGNRDSPNRCCWCGGTARTGLYVRGGPPAGSCRDPLHSDEAASFVKGNDDG